MLTTRAGVRHRMHTCAALAVAGAGLTFAAAGAEQVLMVDAGATWSNPGSPVVLSTSADSHGDWSAVGGFYEGELRIELEVLAIQTSKSFTPSVEFRPSGKGGIRVKMSGVHGPGVYEKQLQVRSLRTAMQGSRPRDSEFRARFKSGIGQVALVAEGCDPKAGDPDLFPMTVHLRVWVVSGRARFNPHDEYGGVRASEIADLRRVSYNLAAGRLGQALVEAQKSVADGENAAVASRVVAALQQYAASRRGELSSVRFESPTFILNRHLALAREFAGSELGAEIARENSAWQSDPETRTAMLAIGVLEQFERKLRVVKPKLRGLPVSDPSVSKRYATDIRSLERYYDVLSSRYESTPAFRRARMLGASIGLNGGGALVAAKTPPVGIAANTRTTRKPPPRKPSRVVARNPQVAPPLPPATGNGASRLPTYTDEKKELPGDQIENGGFEIRAHGGRTPVAWTGHQWGAFRAQYSIRLDRGNVHGGDLALDIRGIDREARPGVYTLITAPAGKYRLTYWVCADLDEVAELSLKIGMLQLQPAVATEDWRKVTQIVQLNDAVRNVKLCFQIDTPRARVWLDDVEMVGIE